MSLVTIALRMAGTTSGAARAVRARRISRGMISRDVAPSPQSSPSGIARTTAAISQTYSGTPPGRLYGSSATAGTARSSGGVAGSVGSAFDITGSEYRGPDQ